MAPSRNILDILSILSLLALVLALGAPATGGHGHAVEPANVIATVAEPCPATSATLRCEVKALPVRLAATGLVPDGDGATLLAADGSARGVWPEVEPDPPRQRA